MSKSPHIQERIKEVKTLLLQQRDRKYIIENYSEKWDVGIKSIDVYIGKAKDLIKAEAGQLEQIEQRKLEEHAEKNVYHKLTLAQKLDVLYRIATGNIKFPAIDAKGKRVWVRPSYQDRIKAIELENAMTGEGFRPPENPGGNTFNGPVTNNISRVTVFKTRKMEMLPQVFETPQQ